MLRPLVALLPLVAVVALAAPALAQDGHGEHVEGGFDSGRMDARAEWSHRFQEPGTYGYHCVPHPTLMEGRVVVSAEAPAGDVVVEVGEFAFTPANVTVRPGALVTWRNAGAEWHTATQTTGPVARDDAHAHGGARVAAPGVALALLAALGVALGRARRVRPSI